MQVKQTDSYLKISYFENMSGRWKYMRLTVVAIFFSTCSVAQDGNVEPEFEDNSILKQTWLTIREVHISGNKKTKNILSTGKSF